MIYMMYICTINLKQEQKWNTQQNKSKTQKETITQC